MDTLTINQYLINPAGKGAAASSISSLKEEYNARYNALIAIHEEFEMNIYNHKSIYYIHFKIPSETKENINYDIVLKFDFTRVPPDTSMFNLPIQVICNSPSFVFTYAYVFRRKKFIIEELSDLITRKALKESPDTRNPYKAMGLEKTLYYACKYLRANVSGRNYLETHSEPLNLKELKKDILTFDEIMDVIDDYMKKKSRENKKLKDEKQKRINKIVQGRQHTINTDGVTTDKIDRNVKKAQKSAVAKKFATSKKATTSKVVKRH